MGICKIESLQSTGLKWLFAEKVVFSMGGPGFGGEKGGQGWSVKAGK
jgi:hypothetical protein